MITDDPEEDFDEFGDEPDHWLGQHLKRLSARDDRREKQREENDSWSLLTVSDPTSKYIILENGQKYALPPNYMDTILKDAQIPKIDTENRKLIFITGKTKGYISARDFIRAHNAIEFLNTTGAIMNIELTVVPKHCGQESCDEVDKFYKNLYKKFNDMCRKWGIQARHITVFERSMEFGFHFHSMISIPSEHMEKFNMWLPKALAPIHKRALRPPGLWRVKARTKATVKSQWRWFDYCMKGLDEHEKAPSGRLFHEVVGLKKRRFPGEIDMKRLRISESISKEQQYRAHFEGITTQSNWEKLEWRSSHCWDVFESQRLAALGINGVEN